jgi:hypothetical protein
MSQNPPEPVYRTFRFYLDVEARDDFPGDQEEEWRVLEEAQISFYAMIDDGMEPDVLEVTEHGALLPVRMPYRP